MLGVAPEERNEAFDFEEELRTIHVSLDLLNEEAVKLAARVAANLKGLGV